MDGLQFGSLRIYKPNSANKGISIDLQLDDAVGWITMDGDVPAGYSPGLAKHESKLAEQWREAFKDDLGFLEFMNIRGYPINENEDQVSNDMLMLTPKVRNQISKVEQTRNLQKENASRFWDEVKKTFPNDIQQDLPGELRSNDSSYRALQECIPSIEAILRSGKPVDGNPFHLALQH